jgi:hypothetical protein
MRSITSTVAAAVLVLGIAASACSNAADDGAPSSATVAGISATDATTTTTSVTTSTTTSTTTSVTSTATTDPAELPADEAAPPARLDAALVAELDADGFAAALSSSHVDMVDPNADPGARERAGVDYQLVLRELADRPDLDEAVLAAVIAEARPAAEAIIRARQFLQERSASRPPQPLPDELPAWTIVEPEPIETLLGYYAEAEQLTGIAWYWLAAIHLQETRMGRIQGVSSAGAVGPMQFLPSTWEGCCTGDPRVTRDAIIGAATYLAQSGGPDDMAAAVYQYNPNDGYVAVVTAYAESLRDEPELYAGYHAFQVFFGSAAGTVRLPIGYAETTPIDAAAHLAANPRDAA